MPTIALIGTRGLPNRHGGFERFIELLVQDPRWAKTDVRFVVYGEAENGPYNAWTSQRNVGFTKDSRKLRFYFRSAMLATRECDAVLCCSVPLSIFSFWPRLNGKPLIMNPDGCEWRRTKWSLLGRAAIAAMYVPAITAASRVVIDAEALREDFHLGSKGVYIPYSAPEPAVHPLNERTRERVGITRPYMLLIARLEPENNVALALKAFHALGDRGVDMIVVGSTKTRHYEETLSAMDGGNIRFVGPLYDQQMLDELRSNCVAYFHGHSVGGTNPSLLEALSAVTGALICHDNKYNREVAGDEAEYYGDPKALSARFAEIIEALPDGAPARAPRRDARFHPDAIFDRYLALFQEVLAR
ncbi:glycosyltransferase [Phenylobacterium sp.]|uniref:glycosyltransferase n=1 Tax=Phenylobacterium sp. TaxID=1871053 RepID=UPI0028123BC2|nr:glycosyltransferase [Phenylobacterium sp.]